MPPKCPTMDEVAADRVGKPIPKGPSRLQQSTAAKKLRIVGEAAFKREVRERDKWRCRRCERTVKALMTRSPERAEVHHLHGRRGDLRFDARAALLLCLECHELVTGRVNERWIILPTQTFTTRHGEYTDARAKVNFERVA